MPRDKFKLLLLASYFAHKMTVQNADKCKPEIVNRTAKTLKSFQVTGKIVLEELKFLETTKAIGSDKMSPHTLKPLR